jgi:hypothetical protein
VVKNESKVDKIALKTTPLQKKINWFEIFTANQNPATKE